MGLRPDSLLPGRVAPAISGADTNQVLTIGRASDGRLQLLLFERGHWCASCRRHLALAAEHAQAFIERDIDVIAVTHESQLDCLGRVYPFPLVADADLEIATQFDLTGIDEFGAHTIRPAAVVVRESGEVVLSYVGDDSRDRLTIPALLLAIDNGV